MTWTLIVDCFWTREFEHVTAVRKTPDGGVPQVRPTPLLVSRHETLADELVQVSAGNELVPLDDGLHVLDHAFGVFPRGKNDVVDDVRRSRTPARRRTIAIRGGVPIVRSVCGVGAARSGTAASVRPRISENQALDTLVDGVRNQILQRRNHDVADDIFDDALAVFGFRKEHCADSLTEGRLPPYCLTLDDLHDDFFVGFYRTKLPGFATVARKILHDHLKREKLKGRVIWPISLSDTVDVIFRCSLRSARQCGSRFPSPS